MSLYCVICQAEVDCDEQPIGELSPVCRACWWALRELFAYSIDVERYVVCSKSEDVARGFPDSHAHSGKRGG